MSKRFPVLGGLLCLAGLAAVPVNIGAAADVAQSPAYNTYCMVCHGPGGAGVEGLGVSLTDSRLIRSSTQEEIVSFLRVGRLPDDPDTVSGRPMPGFDYLPEAELMEIASFLKQE